MQRGRGAPRSKASLACKASRVPRGGSLLDDYQSALDSKPILTKASTSLVGFGVSDALTQLFIEKGETIKVDTRSGEYLSRG